MLTAHNIDNAVTWCENEPLPQVGFGEVLDRRCMVAKPEVQGRTGPFAITLF